jgi:hypothetical protein
MNACFCICFSEAIQFSLHILVCPEDVVKVCSSGCLDSKCCCIGGDGLFWYWLLLARSVGLHDARRIDDIDNARTYASIARTGGEIKAADNAVRGLVSQGTCLPKQT